MSFKKQSLFAALTESRLAARKKVMVCSNAVLCTLGQSANLQDGLDGSVKAVSQASD